MPVNSMVLAASLVFADILVLTAAAQVAAPPAVPVPQAQPAVPVAPPPPQFVPVVQQVWQQQVWVAGNGQVIAVANNMVPAAPAPRAGSTNNDEESVLKISRLKTTDEALLDFFRKRALPAPRRNVLEQVAHTLASLKPEEADAAQAELISRGTPVAAVLREVANRLDNLSVAQRAKLILQILEGPLATNLPVEVARLLATRKPAGAVEILLEYLAVADNDNVIREVVAALAVIGCPKGQPEPTITAALHSPQSVRRAAAAQILCQVGGTANLKAVRPLMKDPDPTVRFKATLALADAYDNEAIPVLVDLMGEAPSTLQTQVEKYLTRLAGEFAVHGPRGQDALSCQLRYHTWSTWWKHTDGAHLLQAFQAHTLTDEELEQARKSVAQLGALDSKAKESAMRDLEALGKRVVPLLRRAVQQQHPQISPAAEQCLSSIESETPFTPLPEAALRLLQLRRPAGTVAALLAYLPCAEDEGAIGRIQEALVRTGVVDGKPDPVLTQALQDKIGLRRSVAATVLCRGHATEALELVRPLLEDKDMGVRQQVAQEMAVAGDKGAVEVLIGLLDKLPGERAWMAEECLEKLAGNKAPAEIEAGEEIAWAKVGQKWLEWWKGDKSKVAMVDADSSSTFRGFTLLVQQQTGTVTELNAQGKPRWTLKGLANPTDAQVVSGQRVLVVEQGNRVTERNLQGKILWEKQVPNGVMNIQRLRNGNTFIACQNQLMEVDRAGKEVLTIPCPRGVRAARKLPNGHFAYYEGNNLVQLDKKGQEIKRSAPLNAGGGGNNEVLDNGHALILSPGNGNLIEFDPDGKEVGRFDIQGANHACRLPNGHTLLTIWGNGNKYLELDKNWKQIKETPLDTPTLRVKRR